MLTVKNVTWDGREDIIEARRVSTGRVLDNDAQTSDSRWKEQVYAHIADEDVVIFEYGNVYVMNGNGKTVSIYTLPAGPSVPASEIKA